MKYFQGNYIKANPTAEGLDYNLFIKEKSITETDLSQLHKFISKDRLEELNQEDVRNPKEISTPGPKLVEALDVSVIPVERRQEQGPTLTESCFEEVNELNTQLTPPRSQEGLKSMEEGQPMEIKLDQKVEIEKEEPNPDENPTEMDQLEEPKLDQKKSSYGSYCESYFDTINELTDVMEGLGVEFDKLVKNTAEEEKCQKDENQPASRKDLRDEIKAVGKDLPDQKEIQDGSLEPKIIQDQTEVPKAKTEEKSEKDVNDGFAPIEPPKAEPKYNPFGFIESPKPEPKAELKTDDIEAQIHKPAYPDISGLAPVKPDEDFNPERLEEKAKPKFFVPSDLPEPLHQEPDLPAGLDPQNLTEALELEKVVQESENVNFSIPKNLPDHKEDYSKSPVANDYGNVEKFHPQLLQGLETKLPNPEEEKYLKEVEELRKLEQETFRGSKHKNIIYHPSLGRIDGTAIMCSI